MIISSKFIGTENVTQRFEKVSTDLFLYIQLGLIKGSDLPLYIKYLELYNPNFGYAFPTIYQLQDYLNCSRSSVMEANKRLVAAGLLEKGKYRQNNNVYIPLQPLSRKELFKQIPNKFNQLESRQKRIYNHAKNDKVRFSLKCNSNNNSE